MVKMIIRPGSRLAQGRVGAPWLDPDGEQAFQKPELEGHEVMKGMKEVPKARRPPCPGNQPIAMIEKAPGFEIAS